MQEKKTFKNNFRDPLKNKRKTMRLNHFLSNRYTLFVLVIIIDLIFFFIANYFSSVLRNLPGMLKGEIVVSELVSWKHIFHPSFTIVSGIIFLLFLAGFDVMLIYKFKISFSEDWLNVGQKGTARWTTTEEIVEEYKEIPMLDTPYKGMPGIRIAAIGDYLYIDDSIVNNLEIGITRSGKGELFIKSAIETYTRAEIQPSLIINDGKLEHYKFFKDELERRGYLVYLLNCSNPSLSMGYNPLALAVQLWKKKDYDTAEMVIDSFAYSWFNVDQASGDMKFFTNSACALCRAMIIAAVDDAIKADEEDNQIRYEQWQRLSPEDQRNRPFVYINKNEKTINFYSMIITFGQMVRQPIEETGTKTMLDKYFENRPSDDPASLAYLGVQIAPGKTKSGVFSEMLQELDIFTKRKVAQMTAESSLDFMELGFGEKPIAVFMATPSYDQSLYKIPAIFIRQMYYALGKACDDHTGRCERPVKNILDEAGNMPEIDMLDTMVTYGLGMWISFDFAIQNYEQLTEKYGEKRAQTIKGNCGNHIFIQTKSEDTAKEFSEMFGDESYLNVDRAGGKLSTHKYFTERVDNKPLIYPQQLMELQEGECIIHRTMKRRDNQGKKIKPRAIFNSIESGRDLKYAYEYFPDKYKNANEVSLMEICTESREHINHKKIVWDINRSFEMQREGQIKIKRLEDVPDKDNVNKMLQHLLGVHYQTEYGITDETSIAELEDFFYKKRKSDGTIFTDAEVVEAHALIAVIRSKEVVA